MHKVFISYSTKDVHFAQAICSWLERNDISCWIAPRNITPGSNFGEAIIKALQDTHIMIIVFTANANESKYVNREVERAVSKGVIIIPVRFQDIMPSSAMEFFLSSQHWLDAIDPPFKKHLDKLVASVKALLNTSRTAVTVVNNREKDLADIKLFNELKPVDFDPPPKNKIAAWFHNLLKDKS